MPILVFIGRLPDTTYKSQGTRLRAMTAGTSWLSTEQGRKPTVVLQTGPAQHRGKGADAPGVREQKEGSKTRPRAENRNHFP